MPELTRRSLLRGTGAGVGGFAIAAGGGSVAADDDGRGPLSRHVENFELVGHSPLLYRGMNSALAVAGDHVYVGSRTDGSHPNAGVLVVDVSNPADPRVVDQVTPPDEGNPGESSRELRVWPQAGLLIVCTFECDSVAHACHGADAPPVQPRPRFRFYDITGDAASSPVRVSTYEPSRVPHEFYLWVDPDDPDRALLFASTPHADGDQLLVTDISGARDDEFEEVASWRVGFDERTSTLHSLSVSPDGTRLYLAHSGDGVLVANATPLTRGSADGRRSIELLTSPEDAPSWGVPGAHSAVPIPGGDHVYVTDESYGEYFGITETPFVGFDDVATGCPWTWSRVIDASDAGDPAVVAEYRIPENHESYCDRAGTERATQSDTTSFSSHNPTVTQNVGLVTWHGGGLQAVDLSDPRSPEGVGEFRPRALAAVATEDPALTQGRYDVAMWSYPVVSDGLVYVTDIRNGLYVLRYTGPHAAEVAALEFYEGNSNRGDATKFG